MNIREAKFTDAAQIHALLAELGYSPSPEVFQKQFSIYLSSDSARVFAAEETNSSVVLGVLSACFLPLFHESGSIGRITALVASSKARNKGIGSALVSSAETWFRSCGCCRIEVTSGDARLEAHKFYQRHGFVITGKRFVKRYDST